MKPPISTYDLPDAAPAQLLRELLDVGLVAVAVDEHGVRGAQLGDHGGGQLRLEVRVVDPARPGTWLTANSAARPRVSRTATCGSEVRTASAEVASMNWKSAPALGGSLPLPHHASRRPGRGWRPSEHESSGDDERGVANESPHRSGSLSWRRCGQGDGCSRGLSRWRRRLRSAMWATSGKAPRLPADGDHAVRAKAEAKCLEGLSPASRRAPAPGRAPAPTTASSCHRDHLGVLHPRRGAPTSLPGGWRDDPRSPGGAAGGGRDR